MPLFGTHYLRNGKNYNLYAAYNRGSDGSGSKIFDTGWVGLGQFFIAHVGLGQLSLVRVWVWKISPKNLKFFNFLPFGTKNLIGLGQKVPGSKTVDLLFTAGQKYANANSLKKK